MPEKNGYRPPEAADYLGSIQLLRECVAAGWIEPVVKRKKMVVYDVADLARCWARIRKGDAPPQIVK